MMKQWRIRRLEDEITVQQAKTECLREAEREYGRAYYTDLLIKQIEKVNRLKVKLERLKP